MSIQKNIPETAKESPRPLPVKPVHRTSLAEEIIAQIKSLIDSGHLVLGARLPGERELAQMFGVSRPSVREALKALSLLGIVENRPGSGTYLSDSADRWPSEPFSILFSIRKSVLFDIFEARMSLDGTAASLAARRSNPEDLAMMKESLDSMERNLNNPEAYSQHETAFHIAVIEASKNQVIALLTEKLYRLLQEAREKFRDVVDSPDSYREWDFHNHERIYQMIEQGDETGAYEAMVAHLTAFERYLRKEMRESGSEPKDK
jgi:GntR family transcriptional repressor for pyruvate dehydrogenase complex